MDILSVNCCSSSHGENVAQMHGSAIISPHLLAVSVLACKPESFSGHAKGGLPSKSMIKRLVDIGARRASQLGSLLSKCCAGNEAALLGGYRLVHNEEVKPEAIREGGFAAMVRQASPENLERMLAITAFLAVRLLQLQESHDMPASLQAKKCNAGLSEDEWKILWVSTEHCPLPSSPPAADWAYLALAKLGGVVDTKRTGRPSWSTMWHAGFVCKSVSKVTNSVSNWRLNCDQETAPAGEQSEPLRDFHVKRIFPRRFSAMGDSPTGC